MKLETASEGETTIGIVDRLTELGVPVQGHIGLTPQRMNAIGGPYIQGRGHEHSADVETLLSTAERLVEAGVFSLVLEEVTEAAAKRITDAVDVPTIGIGAGRYLDEVEIGAFPARENVYDPIEDSE